MAAFAFPPPVMAAVINASYAGGHLIAGPKACSKCYYGSDIISDGHKATFRFNNVMRLALAAAYSLADKACTSREDRRDLNIVTATACLADAAVAQYGRDKEGLDDKQANVLSGIAFAVGAYAAFEVRTSRLHHSLSPLPLTQSTRRSRGSTMNRSRAA